MNIELEYVENSDIYHAIIEEGMLRARESVWIASANIKNLRVRQNKRRYAISIIAVFERLVRHGIEIRILHGIAPSKSFQNRLNRSRLLRVSPNFKMVQCPRIHMKTVIIDGRKGYLGSANLTGAGLGLKSETQRNFEVGIIFQERQLLDRLITFFQFIWQGEMCQDCALRHVCSKPIQ